MKGKVAMRAGLALRRTALALALLTQAAAGADREWGQHLSSECATCHQTSGRREGGIPTIISPPADQFVALMVSYKERQRENPVMQAIAARLSRDEIEALAAHYGSLEAAG